jgi:hypothetical protein
VFSPQSLQVPPIHYGLGDVAALLESRVGEPGAWHMSSPALTHHVP